MAILVLGILSIIFWIAASKVDASEIFTHRLKDVLSAVLIVFGTVASAFTLVMICYTCYAISSCPALEAKMDARHENLIGQIEVVNHEAGKDEFVKKALFTDIREWNEELREYRGYKENPWTSIMFPANIYRYEEIDVRRIKGKTD